MPIRRWNNTVGGRSRLPEIVTQVACRVSLGTLPEPEQLGAALRALLAHRDASTRDVLLGSLLTGTMVLGPRADHVAALLRAAFSLDGHDPSARMTVALPPGERLVGVAGSGKTSTKTLDVATPSALLAASLGAYVARSGSTSTTSTDLIEDLGVNVDGSTRDVVRTLQQTGFGFFSVERVVPRFDAVFGGRFHAPHVLGFALSALACPVKTNALVLGLSHPDVRLGLEVLKEFGVADATVVSTTSADGHVTDEIGVFGESRLAMMVGGTIEPPVVFRPSELFRLPPYDRDDVGESSTRNDNARRVVQALRGRGSPGVIDIICANAANILCAAGRAADLREGFEKARLALDGDLPIQKLEEVIVASGGSSRRLRAWLENTNAPASGRLVRFPTLGDDMTFAE